MNHMYPRVFPGNYKKGIFSLLFLTGRDMKGIDMPTILSASTLDNSFIDAKRKYAGFELSEKREPGKVHFTTIRKFKGLEAEAILVVDASMIVPIQLTCRESSMKSPERRSNDRKYLDVFSSFEYGGSGIWNA